MRSGGGGDKLRPMKTAPDPPLTAPLALIRRMRECAEEHRANAERTRQQVRRAQILLATHKPWDPFRD
jgi:hypothetical protein